ncbi:hypothetical protein K402DRAFT_394192 [Aulographum hederae CBS 113979]|uniref:Uncharacterized protein n=1 Tax=Aulographum hederae CBS 113979 TaxID=1176131 RepID=A0A6G1GYQ8_9PEZI|nr:hypothetical protein K402DRAFT_394192 [Aulographum hederae CBS 113979]
MASGSAVIAVWLKLKLACAGKEKPKGNGGARTTCGVDRKGESGRWISCRCDLGDRDSFAHVRCGTCGLVAMWVSK